MAGTPLATAFVRVRMLIDQNQVKSDVDKSLSGSSDSAAKKEGERAGKTFGGSFSSGLKNMIGGSIALLGLGGVVVGFKEIIDEGTKLQKTTDILTAAEKSHGLAVAANAPLIQQAIDQGARYGATQDQVQGSLTKLINAGVPLKEALQVQQAAMNVAAVTGGSYTDVLNKMVQGGGTAARTLKALGVTQVTGADQAKALTSASKILTDQVSQAGGMAAFAAARHLTLAQAQTLVSGALKGNIADFNKLNIEVLPKSATLAQNLAQAQAILNAKYGAEGQAATKTYAGEQAQLRAAMQDLAGTIGLQVLPYLTDFITKIMSMLTWVKGGSAGAKDLRAAFADLRTVLVSTGAELGKFTNWLTGASTWAAVLRGALLGIGAGIAIIKGIAVATQLWADAQKILDLAMAANPIGIVIVAVAALAGALYMAWTRSATFRDVLISVWTAVRVTVGGVIAWFTQSVPHAFGLVLDWVRANWPLLLGLLTGPIGLAVGMIIKFWPQIFGGLSAAWHTVSSFFATTVATDIIAPFNKIKAFVTSSFDTWWVSHGEAVKAVWRAIWSVILSVFHTFWDPLIAAVRVGTAVLTTVWSAGTAVLATVWRVAWAAISAIYHAYMDPLLAAFRVMLDAFGAAARLGWAVITALFAAAGAVIRTLMTALMAAAETIWNVGWAVVAAAGRQAWDTIRVTLKVVWDLIVGIFSVVLDLLTGHWAQALRDIQTTGTQIWNAIKQYLQSTWQTMINLLVSVFVTPFKATIMGGWVWVRDNVFGPMGTFVTQTVPGWFQSAASSIGKFWSALGGIVRAPVVFVVDNVLDGLISVFDTITSAIGLSSLHINAVHPFGLAAGGLLPGYGGGDIVPALLEPGEAVVSKTTTRQHAAELASWGVPGFAAGGIIPSIGSIVQGIKDVAGGITGSGVPGTSIAAGVGAAIDWTSKTVVTGLLDKVLAAGSGGAAGTLGKIVTTMPRIIIDGMAALINKQASGSGSQIVNYALSFLGKIPYVWGGTSLSSAGADCSGFTGSVYSHFGISAPRTSEAQGAWVKRGDPVPGGLAFYHSPGGGADPGHVAIVQDVNTVISQGGGMGPTLMALHGMPLLWTGTPPGGFPGGAVGGSGPNGGVMSAAEVGALWDSLGGPAYAASNMAQIAFAESGRNPGTVQKGQPPGLTGWGLFQITPTSGINQNGAFGDLLNASNNTRAAISLFKAAGGYSPWASDPIGGSLTASSLSYAGGGTILEPVAGIGLKTGNSYLLGESGPETVTPGLHAAGAAQTLTLLARIADALDRLPQQTGAHVGAAVNGAASAAMSSAYYGGR